MQNFIYFLKEDKLLNLNTTSPLHVKTEQKESSFLCTLFAGQGFYSGRYYKESVLPWVYW